jgi:hypothetical protein
MLKLPTHNLNILIVDEEDNKIENPELLESIYSEITCKRIIKNCKILGSKIDINLIWERFPLTKEEQHFMGELFIYAVYSDKVLDMATKFLLNEIEKKLKNFTTNKKWKIIFHISKLLENVDENDMLSFDC